MKKKRYSVEQITAVLKQAETGASVGDLCRQVGIAEQTFYRWKKVYGGMLPSEARELKQLREENARLRHVVADQTFDKVMLRTSFQRCCKARQAREVVHSLNGRYQVSERRAALAARSCRSSLRYQSRRDPQTALRQRVRELAQTRVWFGYRRLLGPLRREGWELGKHRLHLFRSWPGLARKGP